MTGIFMKARCLILVKFLFLFFSIIMGQGGRGRGGRGRGGRGKAGDEMNNKRIRDREELINDASSRKAKLTNTSFCTFAKPEYGQTEEIHYLIC